MADKLYTKTLHKLKSRCQVANLSNAFYTKSCLLLQHFSTVHDTLQVCC